MQNERPVALLKQVENGVSQSEVRGVARIEKGKMSVSIINLQSSGGGDYYLFYDGVGYPLSGLTGGEINLESGASNGCGVSLILVKGYEITTIAYGTFSPYAKTEKEILSDAKKFFKIENPKETELPVLETQNYDDEAIATENYYELTEKGDEDFERNKNAFGSKASADGECDSVGKAQEEGNANSTWQNENAQSNECSSADEGEYYFKIKSRLNDLFRDFPPQIDLAKMVKESRWAKVENGGKHYVVGVIFAQGEARYICYGLPGKFGEEPQSLTGYSSFIPTSPFDEKGFGYWVMFQDAQNGKRIAKG